ncbi:hypothetical protein L198_07640 [Cryptococcus wingfieldii CBS 7118]|uniref:Uncharacterized protein n=1 Tax=Cryptococcus wingfieldii CBS 7118 TaxID=1295528 RepID=A0A1E3I5I2_9TREE|nr:hypothetical protein L198_07640 [Cryptococcus wingfieldii CBS 7118]ODN83943.1 hypothetical protein L198_07640 [Cryptococcus wingfieldii CBS 7118]
MSKKPTELEAAALTTGWGPAQQAALYHIHLAQQAEKDEEEEIKKAKKKEAKKRGELNPEGVKAGELVDGWIKGRCPALFEFLDVVAPPHLAIGIWVVLHIVYWYAAPWYYHFLIPWPSVYLTPMFCTYKSINSGKDRTLWLSYWPIVMVLEYFELLMFRDQTRTLTWWPKLKAIFCVCMYSIIYHDEKKDPKTKKVTSKTPVFGAIKFIGNFLPEPPAKKKVENGGKDNPKKPSSQDPKAKPKPSK